MTDRPPLPPLPDLDLLASASWPVLAAVVAELREPRPVVAMYEDSPYIADRTRQERP